MQNLSPQQSRWTLDFPKAFISGLSFGKFLTQNTKVKKGGKEHSFIQHFVCSPTEKSEKGMLEELGMLHVLFCFLQSLLANSLNFNQLFHRQYNDT